MEDKKDENVEKEENLEWEKTHQIGTAQNMIPILKSLLLVVEEQKKLTLEKAEQAKKLLATMKKNK